MLAYLLSHQVREKAKLIGLAALCDEINNHYIKLTLSETDRLPPKQAYKIRQKSTSFFAQTSPTLTPSEPLTTVPARAGTALS